MTLSKERIEAIQARAEKATPSVKISGTKEQFGTAWADAVFGHHARKDVLALCQQALRAIELEAEKQELAMQALSLSGELETANAKLKEVEGERVRFNRAYFDKMCALKTELTATRKALEEERERIAKHILEQREGGHCGEGSMEIIARQRNNADLKRAAEFVRLVPAPQVKE